MPCLLAGAAAHRHDLCGAQLRGIDAVVLDGIGAALHLGVFQSRNGADNIDLHVLRQRGRQTLNVQLLRMQTHRLNEELVAFLVRKRDDLRLDRGAVARAGAFNGAVEERTAVKIGADDLVRARFGIGKPAHGAVLQRRGVGGIGKRLDLLIAGLELHFVKADAARVHARRRAGLEAAETKTHIGDALRELRCRGESVRAGGAYHVADDRPSAEICPRSDDNSAHRVYGARVRRDGGNMAVREADGNDLRLFGKTFMALNGVDLTVYKGEALGIIGRNGAGKSTLLKILSRITAPTEGEIRLRGRVASMLEVGTGFNNEMTGRENIYMNGAILGMTRAEVDSKIDQIIEFSECGDFIDTPVKRYSSGMFVKLAFAVAAHLDSEIMVMDEVLAVGDMKFQQKCLGKMSDVAGQEGRTVLYVSHNMSTIRQLCTRCVVLDQGRVIFDGDVEQAIAVYMETTDVNVVHYDLMDVSRMNASAGKRMQLETLDFVGKESSVFADTEKIRVRITWRVSEPFAGVHLKLNLHFRDSTPVGITHPVNLGAAVPGKLYTTEFEFDPSLLGEGQYFFYVDVFDGVLTQAVCLDKPVTEFAFEVTSGDLSMPEWAPGWGRIHFPPVKVLENGYDG